MFQLTTQRTGLLPRLTHCSAAAAALLFLLPADLPGQIILQGNGRIQLRMNVPLPRNAAAGDEADDEENSRLSPRVAVDRELKKRVDMAGDALERKDYRTAVEIIQRGILDRVPAAGSASADYFLDQEMQHSLRRSARSLIAELPAEGRRIYELQYGVTARQLLDRARTTQDLEALEEVVRRYFHTRAGYEAAWLLGSLNLDRGEPLAAARQFEQLLRLPEAVRPREPLLSLKTALAWAQAGMKDRALQILGSLTPALNGKGGESAARTPEETLVWLQQVMGQNRELAPALAQIWNVFGGSANRNGSILPASPVWQTAWSYPTIQRPEAQDPRQYEYVEQRVLELAAERAGSGKVALPVSHPLVVGDTVVFRTLSNIRAVDRRSGKRLWENFFVSPSWTHLVEEGHNETVPVGNRQQSPLDMFLSQRTWQNLTSGTLSTDGSRVFAVESLGFVGPWPAQPGLPAHRLSAGDSNRLVACELSTGRLSWELGGHRGDAELELAGAYFLGPPLPLGGSLYCLAEVSGELRLLVLEAATGELQWWQSLLLSEDPLLQSPERRFSGVGVAAGDGIMVCPTAAGAVIAIDLATRELLWGFRYRKPEPPADRNNLVLMRMRQAMMRGGQLTEEEEQWQDSTPVIAAGRVLLTPADSSELFCLRLSDGQLEWSQPRGQGLYLAGVHQHRAIVVSRTQVEAYDLNQNGSPAWKEPVPIPVPGGRGVRSGRFYYLPLSTDEIATIDLETGRMLVRSPAPDSAAAGNLVAADGGLISQSATGLNGFTPLDTLQNSLAARLQRNSRDASALAVRGELRLHSGQEQAGLTDLREALDVQPDLDRARQALASALLDRLRTDYAAYRHTVPELSQLIDDPQKRWAFHRQNAAGLAESKEFLAAFQELERFAGPETATSGLRPLDGDLLLRGDRWFRSQAENVFRQGTPAEQTAMNQQLRETMDRVLARAARDPAADQPVNRQIPVVAPRPGDRARALKQREISALWRLLQYYSPLPGAETIRVALFERLSGQGDRLQREQLLEQLRGSQNPELAARATFELASLRLSQQDHPDIAGLIDDLATRYGDVLLPDGTPAGRRATQLRSLLKTDRPAGPAWPHRRLVATRDARRGSVQHHYAVEIIGDPGPHFMGWRLELDQQRHFLSAFDADGTKRWSLGLKGLRDASNRVLDVPQNLGNYALIHGHLVAVALGGTLYCLDGLPEAGSPRVLWNRPLYDQHSDSQFRNNISVRQVMVGAGQRKIMVTDPWGRPIGKLGVISRDVVAYQQGTSLFGVDPMTGSTLWERKNIPRGSQIFGDGDYVFASSSGAGQAIMLNAATGEYAGSPLLPGGDSLITSRGRMLVLQEAAEQPGQLRLRGVDAASSETRWSRLLSEGSQFAVIDGVEIAALEPSGKFQIVEIATGEQRVEAQVQPEQNLSQIIVLRDESFYVLMTQQPDNGRNNVRAVAIGMNNPLVNGHVYGFDRTDGRLIWSRAMQQQAFDLSQPNSLPVLIFTVRTYQLFRQGRSFNPNQFSLLMIDKRNGQLVFERSGSESLAPYELDTNPAEGTIEIRFHQSQVGIKVGEEPLESPVLLPGQREPVEAPIPE